MVIILESVNNMKYLLIFLTISPIIVQATDFEEFERTIASYQSQNPKNGEEVTCFPQKQVESWKKRKKLIPKVVEKIVTKETKVWRKNNLSFVMERNHVNIGIDTNTGVAQTEPSWRPGLMYQRDLLEWLRVSGVVTTKGFSLGAGYNF